ncbi:TRAP transporter large permease [Celeribacter indicus]|uniref:TRAP transporter large permease protein n=1 Tax=Celeribacter indicus TaxID=1208324 RepID=A0A0B5DUV2_9RHOB|nr:TRAP transporter large permease subunit [Celeribacter indicus]AJE46804.1 TRAP dicarboxylate transporter subunit DctM [Celeribacter indicus]SDW81524.1 TRAP transporter, DctM subunit [Celeribacter indicus]
MSERELIGALSVAVVVLLVAIRVPVGIAMGLVAFGGISAAISVKAGIGVLSAVPFDLVGDWNLSAIPMFLLMGYVAASTDLTRNLFRSARITLGWLPGGLASATVISAALFASASGSSVATAAAFSRTAVPEMLRARYHPGLATGAVAAAGTLGALIPPSVLMIVYGITMSQSINSLFLAGLMPGLLSAAMFILYITLRVGLKPAIAPRVTETVSEAERREAFRDVWPLPLIIVCVIGGIFAGLFTPTEAGAIGAGLTILLAILRRSFTRAGFTDALRRTATGTASIFIIVVGAALFQRLLGLTGMANLLSDVVSAHIHSQIGLILAIALLYLVMGCFLEPVSIMLLTLPVLTPVLQQFGVDLVWFAVITVKLLEMGMVTPPMGLNIFVVKSAMGEEVSLGQVFRGTFGFLLADLVSLALIIAFPILSLWLPGVAQ